MAFFLQEKRNSLHFYIIQDIAGIYVVFFPSQTDQMDTWEIMQTCFVILVLLCGVIYSILNVSLWKRAN